MQPGHHASPELERINKLKHDMLEASKQGAGALQAVVPADTLAALISQACTRLKGEPTLLEVPCGSWECLIARSMQRVRPLRQGRF